MPKIAIEQFSLRVLFLLFPGLVAVLVIRHLTPRHEESWSLFSIYVVVLGTLSYVMLASVQALISTLFSISFGGELRFFSYLAGTSRQVDPIEVLWSSVFAVLLGLGLTLLINKELLHKFARAIGLSSRLGTADIWDYVFGARGEGAWITIRDQQVGLSYLGWVKASSDTSMEPEIFLQDVSVTDYRGNELYQVQGLYLRRSPEELTIEIEEAVIDGEYLRSWRER